MWVQDETSLKVDLFGKDNCVVNTEGNLRERERGERAVRRTQSEGCAAGGFLSGLSWEVRLGCLRVVAGFACVYSGYNKE